MVSPESEDRPRKARRPSLVDEVAEHAHIRRDVVEDVLSAFYDIAAERLLNDRKLLLTEILSVRTVVTKNGIRPEPHLQFRARVASGLRKLLQRMEASPGLKIDRNNWRAELRRISGSSGDSSEMSLSDFLKDDDEDE